MRNARSSAFASDGFLFGGMGESRPLSVDEVTKRIKGVLEPGFRSLVVVGEVSNKTVNKKTGHCYFTLKDERAQLQSVIWNSDFRRLPFELENGVKVCGRGRVEFYTPHGKCQFVATTLERVGVGSWELRLRELESRFEKEGLFAQSRKKRLPFFIKRVGVATSPSGAALRDFVNTLAAFSKGIEVVVAPTRVQGPGASIEIADAIRDLNANASKLGLDVIALIRGGGSVEDLWEFNEEATVRAIAASELPVITGVGHELDVSLCDRVADVHALTPTAAASCVVKHDRERFQPLEEWKERARRIVETRLSYAGERLQSMALRRVFQEPGQVVWERKTELLDEMTRRLAGAVDATRQRHESRFRETVARLEAMSPLAVLSRGYSITRDIASGKILKNASETKNGDVIETRLNEGVLRSLVLEVADVN